MSTFEDYATKYKCAQMERHEGILQLALHTDGGPLIWDRNVHRELPDLFADIAADQQTRVLIFTGTGDAFCECKGPYDVPGTPSDPRPGYSQPGIPADIWNVSYSEGKRLLQNLLDIDVPIIGAVNGPAHIHAEMAVLSDIVLAADIASFADLHMRDGMVAGDGVHIVWPMLLGSNRGRYFLYTSQIISALEARDLGVVNEVLPQHDLLPRAWEIARTLVAMPPLVTRYSRVATTQQIKRLLVTDLGYGLALEGLAVTAGRVSWDPSTRVPWDPSTPIVGSL